MAWYGNLEGSDIYDPLRRLIERSPYRDDITVFSGKRTLADQQRLFNASDRSGHDVAFPSPSAPHVRGAAADLGWRGGSFKSMPAEVQQWLAANAASEGLYFPMSWEPWHIQVRGNSDIGGPGRPLDYQQSSSSSSLIGSGADDLLEDSLAKTPFKKANFDPVGGGSKHDYRFDAESGRGQFKTSDGRVINYSEPQADPRGGTVKLNLPGGGGGGGGGRPLIGGSDALFTLKPGYRKLLTMGGGDTRSKVATSLRSPAPAPDLPGSSEMRKAVADLAKLDEFEYERQRKALSEKWGVRIGTIDRAVREERERNKPPKATTSTKSTTPKKTTASGKATNSTDILNRARMVIANGTPRDAVIRVLKEQYPDIDTSGL